MTYKKIGDIKNIQDIELDKNVIINGRVNKQSWMWHMTGKFKKRANEIVFRDEHGMYTKVAEGEISLTLLEKV